MCFGFIVFITIYNSTDLTWSQPLIYLMREPRWLNALGKSRNSCSVDEFFLFHTIYILRFAVIIRPKCDSISSHATLYRQRLQYLHRRWFPRVFKVIPSANACVDDAWCNQILPTSEKLILLHKYLSLMILSPADVALCKCIQRV